MTTETIKITIPTKMCHEIFHSGNLGDIPIRFAVPGTDALNKKLSNH